MRSYNPTDCVVGEGGERERERGERERTSSLSQSVKVVFLVVVVCFFFSPLYFVSCHGPCAPKEK